MAQRLRTGSLRVSCVHLRSEDTFIPDATIENNALG